MNSIETHAYNWLVYHKGYNPKLIMYNSSKTPDFVTSDLCYEVKKLYDGNTIKFYEPQWQNMKDEFMVIVFDEIKFTPIYEVTFGDMKAGKIVGLKYLISEQTPDEFIPKETFRKVATVIKQLNESPKGLLTRREYELFDLVASGLRNHEISNQLGIAPRTVETHINNLMRKLDIHKRIDVLNYNHNIN
jgi:DNA-binding CsgD family transcriptional regulator